MGCQGGLQGLKGLPEGQFVADEIGRVDNERGGMGQNTTIDSKDKAIKRDLCGQRSEQILDILAC